MKNLLGVVFVVALSGCSLLSGAKPACQVIDMTDQVCKEFVLADGSHVKVSPTDAKDPQKLGTALKLGGSKDCK